MKKSDWPDPASSSSEGNASGKDQSFPLRVLAVLPQPSSSASMIFAVRQVASLNNAGVICHSFLLASRTSPWMLLKEWIRLRQTIHAFQPDLVHAHYGTVTALLAGLSTNKPLVITYRGSDLNPNRESLPRQILSRFLSQIAALRAAQIISVSQQLRKRLWWRRHRATVIPSGVDTAVFYPRPRKDVRAELGWDEDERVVLFNAADPIAKRLDLARSAIQVAESVLGKIRLLILDGQRAPHVIPAMMNAADCLLLTSNWEGSPNVVKEALACNLPLVSVEVGDVRERLSGVRPSAIVGRDPREIAASLVQILRQPQRSNGREFVTELSSEAVAKQIVSLYRAVRRPSRFAPGKSLTWRSPALPSLRR